jgi:hypothetical protein
MEDQVDSVCLESRTGEYPWVVRVEYNETETIECLGKSIEAAVTHAEKWLKDEFHLE